MQLFTYEATNHIFLPKIKYIAKHSIEYLCYVANIHFKLLGWLKCSNILHLVGIFVLRKKNHVSKKKKSISNSRSSDLNLNDDVRISVP